MQLPGSCNYCGKINHFPGLFHRAILESGNEMASFAINPPESDPEDYTWQVADELGCVDEDASAMFDCLRELPWRQIQRANFTCTVGVLHPYILVILPET